MNISKEDYDELISILADRQVAFVLAVPADLAMASEDQKEEMKNQMQEINKMTANELKDLLDDDNYQIYTAYKDSISIRRNLNSFMDTLLPEERLKEAQTEQLIESMYLNRKTIFDEMDPGEEPESVADISRILEKQKQVYDNYLEISSNTLTEEQVEKYRIYLEKQLRRYRSQLYITLTK